MKYNICLVVLILVSALANAQQLTSSSSNKDTTSLLIRSGFKNCLFGTGTVIPDQNDKFFIPFEWGTFGGELINAYLIDDSAKSLPLFITEAKLHSDKLEILISGFNGVVSQDYLIIVYKEKYRAGYQMNETIEIVERKISPIKTQVKLNTLNFKKGMEVRGYTEFIGKCTTGCGPEPLEVKIVGNFSVLIK